MKPVPCCNLIFSVCNEDIQVTNAVSARNPASLTMIGKKLTVTCLSGYHWKLGQNVQEFECQERGFDKSQLVSMCYKGT